MKTVIFNVDVIGPNLRIDNGAVIIDNDIVLEVLDSGQFASCNLDEFDCVVDGEGGYLMPGFIDIHTHGAGGCNVMSGSSSDLNTIANEKLKCGVTTLIPSTVAASKDIIKGVFNSVASYRLEGEPICRIPGVHLEGPFFNKSLAGAQNGDYIIPIDTNWLESLNNIAPIKIVSLSSELPGALEAIKKLTAQGIVCSHAHSDASSGEVKEAADNGLTHLTHFCNRMTPLHHRDIGAVGQGIINDNLSLEIIGDKIHLCPDMLRFICKLKPLDKIMLITDSLFVTGMPNGNYSIDGVDVVLLDGVVRMKDGNLAGSTLLYNEGLKNLYEVTELPLQDLVRITSLNQANSLKLERLGEIKENFFADLVLLDRNFAVQRCWVGGEARYQK